MKRLLSYIYNVVLFVPIAGICGVLYLIAVVYRRGFAKR